MNLYRGNAKGGRQIKRTLVLLALIAAVASLGAPRSSAGIQKYYDGTFVPYQEAVSGWNYWQTDRVWRPFGEYFALYFLNSVPGLHGYQINGTNNPFTIYGSFGYDRGACKDVEGNGASPVTCQVYTYYA